MIFLNEVWCSGSVTSPHGCYDPRVELQLVPVHLPAEDIAAFSHRESLKVRKLLLFINKSVYFLPEQLLHTRYPLEYETSSRDAGWNHLAGCTGVTGPGYKIK